MRLLEALAEAVEENAAFFKPAILPLAELLSAIGRSDHVADGIRQVRPPTLCHADC